MTIPSSLRRVSLLLALPLLLLVSACDRHDHEDDDHFGTVDRIEVRDRTTNTLYAFFQRNQADDQFQEADGPLTLTVGDEVALNVHFIDVEGRQATLQGTDEYQLGVRLAEQRDGVVGQPGVVEIEAHGDHADITALAEGETHLVFQLMHGNHSDFDSPPLRVVVGHDNNDT